ncbi:unnamed protein product [Didymodactylos carnosus]|uniref:Uncharacterized protein n=1 Tax=Didymodactylos carnosus TaxID=1234261 RepID=A0A814TFA6_9BILA|nr:unnamed protein product [Didymodactylos carnosus]CAF1161396.1 unnamed protein product [Didymodactylos carnosus]CAF3697660.1 unnamed protein product [Didymodactylos carnosus]CAF3924999.1 unnamed protein product [Didymodactylos carnosus]
MSKELTKLIPGCYAQGDRQAKRFITDKLPLLMSLDANMWSEIIRLFQELKQSDHFKDNVSTLLTFDGSRVKSKETLFET